MLLLESRSHWIHLSLLFAAFSFRRWSPPTLCEIPGHLAASCMAMLTS